MKLQNLLFPFPEICNEKNMYYRLNGVDECIQESTLFFSKSSTATFDTYFNSFSIRTWACYTILNNVQLHLFLSGKVRVTVFSRELVGSKIISKDLMIIELVSTEKKEFILDLPMNEQRGMLAFTLEGLCDASYHGGFYSTNICTSDLSSVNIAVTICTYKREFFIKKIIEAFNQVVTEDPLSEIFHKYHVFIADNGQTLDCAQLSNDYIHIYPNKNLGGAGGFTRGLIEILNQKNSTPFSHVLFLDDDILLQPEALLRTYTLLQMLREEYREAFVTGGQFFMDQKNIQAELGAYWDTAKHHPIKYKYDLNEVKWILKNAIQDKMNYLGWCYCCMPFSKISLENLPLPLFIKRDDIEYGLRNGTIFIGLNGICMWHEPFEYKRSTYLEYYYIRNACIIDAIHRPNYGAKQANKALFRYIVKSLLMYRYKEANLYLDGLNDFLKGIDWLKEQDGEYINKLVMSKSYQLLPVEKINFQFSYGRYEGSLSYKETRKNKIKRLLTVNGWLLPSNRTAIVPTVSPHLGCFYRAKTVLNYECITNKGYLTSKSYSEAFSILKKYIKMQKLVRQQYEIAKNSYHSRYRELTSIEFWNDYLNTNTNTKAPLPPAKRSKTTLYDIKIWYVSKLLRGLQMMLFLIPLKKNRVMLHVHNRKGYTCNPKYVAEALLKKYPDMFEIYWATDYPETCQNLLEKQIIPIKTKSLAFLWKCLRTKVLITNDHFPVYIYKRKKQFLINTWHASVAYKKIGFSINYDRGPIKSKIFEYEHRGTDLITSGSQTFSDHMPPSFHLPDHICKLTGSPRNDILFMDNRLLTQRIKQYYHIAENTKIVLYAPTFRGLGSGSSSTHGLNFPRLLQALHNRFGGEWVCLYRSHYFYNNTSMVQDVINVTDYPDMQELLVMADVFITDYSSAIWDFSITLKPSFIYATDLQEYISNDRDFYNPISEWPYPVAQNNQQLENQILNFNNADYEKSLTSHQKQLGLYETGHTSEAIAEIIYQQCFNR